VAEASGSLSANVCGNTLLVGEYPIVYQSYNSSAIILNNDFSAATCRGMGHYNLADSINSVQFFGNKLNEGASFHVQVGIANGFGWFLGNNTYLDTNNNTMLAPFLDPVAAAVHQSN
jgi:hypothetical protein